MSNEPNRIIRKRCPSCSKEYSGPVVVCPADNTLLVPIKESLVGQVLANKYQVLEEVGRGGMSIVYRGRHGVMDRMVAIKMLQAQLLADQTSIKRFQREAQAVACIQHPNVITVYDCDIHDGVPYIVMDFLTGESLADMIRRDNHISVDRIFKIFSCVTDALEHAHQKGVLHRDLKSSNIMLVNTDTQRDVVKVVDFGIAKILPSSGKQAQNLTATGEIFGSPIYMSPEQCQGLALDTRSDIYSTGVMLYEALTGEPPLMGENIVDTMQMHVTTQPVPFAQIRPDLYIPQNLEAIVAKSLAKNPDQRFQSMAEFKEALDYAEKTGGSVPADRQPMRPVARTTKSTRQNLTGSRPPSSLPKPMLDVEPTPSPAPSSRQSYSDSVPDPRMASAKHREISKPSQGRSTMAPGRNSAKAAQTKARVQEDDDDESKKKKIILIAAIVMIVIAIALIVAFFLVKH